MIRLVYSNRTEELLAALAEDLDSHGRRPGASVFATTHLVVPNRHVDALVRVAVARRSGVSFNMATHLLPDLLPDLLSGASPRRGERLRLLDRTALRGLLLSVLSGTKAGDHRAALGPVVEYVHGDGHRDDAADVRRFQLATELAGVFIDYAFTRPEMLEAWREGRLTLADSPSAGEERWQRALWLEVFGREGAVQRSAARGERWVTVSELLDPSSPVSLQRIELPDRLYFLGFSHLGRSLHRLVAAMAERSRVFVYALNPCEEFWEDLAGASVRSEAASRRGPDEHDPYGLEREGDTPLLRLWGRPGRENIRSLNALSQCDFEPRFVDPNEAGATLLHQLQHDVLRRNPARPRPGEGPSPFVADESVRVLSCRGVRREAEVVANEIWRLLRDDPELKFDDVAVVLPSRVAARYVPHLAAAFGECGQTPFTVLDLPAPRDSRAIEAVELLLALPFGVFGRHDLLRLCTHPLVAARFPDDDAATWVAWADALGIVHGADHKDHSDTYIARDILNWEQGVRRLALGAFMTGERSGDTRVFHAGGEDYLPEEHTQASQLSAGRFALLIRSLTTDARAARSQRRRPADWVRFFRLLVKSYLAPSSEREGKELTACVEALAAVDDEALGGLEVPYRVAYQLAISALGELKSKTGVYPCEGVAIGSYETLRGVPFRVVFAMGLSEGAFPEVERRNPLDLRAVRAKTSDQGQRDGDRYAFLETLLNTRDRLYLSYVGRDPVTGEPQQASSIVLDLCDVLERGYLPRREVEGLWVEHPLRRYDQAYHPDLFGLSTTGRRLTSALPEARREAQARALGEHLRAHVGAHAAIDARALERANPTAWRRLSRLLQTFSLPEAGAPGEGQRPAIDEAPVGAEAARPLRVSASTLRKFLECPMQGYAGFVLRLADDEDDALAVEDEPFSMSRMHETSSLREWFTEAVVRGVDPVMLYDRRIARLERRGRAPTGLFAEIERDRHRACLRAWSRAVAPMVEQAGGAVVLRFGPTDEHGYVDRALAPVELEVVVPGASGGPVGRRVRVEIVGSTSLMLERPRASLLLSPREGRRDPSGKLRAEKSLLRALIDHALATASGATQGGPHEGVFVDGDGLTSAVAFEAFDSTAAARAYLEALVVDLLTGPHAYLMPFEAVFAHKAEGKTIEAEVESLRGTDHFSSRYGPVKRIDDLEAPTADAAASMIDRRFAPFFARCAASLSTT